MTLPRATYRLQFRDGMTFDGAAKLAPYLAQLGVSHLYASPIFTAPPGSTHGYDVADHAEIDPVLGGRDGFDRMVEALRSNGLGLILDIVPNHMAADLANPWWRSVVEWGRQSPFAGHFDIDWRERLTLPLLGRPYPEALEGGDIRLALDARRGWIGLALGTLVIPLHPASYESVLATFRAPQAKRIIEEAGRAAAENPEDFHARLRPILADAAALEVEMHEASRDGGFVDWVHDQQPWELIHWKEARRHLSYRRFFEITGLAGVRVEDDAVFNDVHRLVLELVRDGTVDGLRIDHVDGLADPASYLKRLRAEIGPETYLVVEKILEGDETLPTDWPVDGTTGYEFIDSLADIFVDAEQSEELDEAYGGALGVTPEPQAMVREAREHTLAHNFAGELAALGRLAGNAASQAGVSIPQDALGEALAAVIVALPVYRTYATRHGVSDHDREIVEDAARTAIERLGPERREAVEFLRRLVLDADDLGANEPARVFREKLQQLSGPVMAKAVEDTVFYRHNRLIALNEVGCDPLRARGGVERFHARALRAAETGDLSLLATATHDTKRGEDARARLLALSEAPEAWSRAIERWRAMHRGAISSLPDGPAPDAATEWLIYQALAGIWRDDDERPVAATLAGLGARFLPYLEKALREAKTRTSWTEVREDYEAAAEAYARRLLDPGNHVFHADFASTLRPFAAAGRINSLAQTLLKLTAPGVPDIYQGSEGGDYSLVDPDNRQAIDFTALADRLDRAQAVPDHDVSPSGFARVKQDLVARVLTYRSRRPHLFSKGQYVPLAIEGSRAGHAVAFARQDGDGLAITIVPRLVLDGIDMQSGRVAPEWWGDTRVVAIAGMTDGPLEDILAGRRRPAVDGLPLGDVLGERSVALLSTST